jgi:hypothetical protein
LAASAVAALALTIGLLAFPILTASATTPGWEPDPNSVGAITLYNSSGTAIAGGQLTDAPAATYYAGQASPPLLGGTTGTKAQVLLYTPTAGTPDTWGSCDILTGTTSYPVSGAPAPINTLTEPVATGTSGDLTISNLISVCPNTLTDAGHQNMYQLRLFVSAPGVGTSAKYDSVDILVNTLAGTWSVAYPAAPSGTATLSGPHRVGSTDSCVAAFSNATSYTYRWLINGVANSVTTSTYKIADSDYQKTIGCEITATGPGGFTIGSSTTSVVAIGAALKAVKKPKLSGSHVHGKLETASTGTWSPAATSYSYRWYSGTKAIKGATKKKFMVPASLVGHTIYCKVTAHRAAWTNGVSKTAAVKITM